MRKLKLGTPYGIIRNIINDNKLKTIIIETGIENIYIPNENKFIVTKEFLANVTDVFCGCHTLEKIDMEKFDFSEITTMTCWFWKSKNLKEIIFPTVADCNQLTDLYGCFSETTLGVIDLSFMEMLENNKIRFMRTFKHSKAQKIILPKCQILNMEECFSDCLNLEEVVAPVNIDLSLEDVLFETFDKCEQVQLVDFQKGKFDVENFVNKITHPNNKNNLPDDCVIILP